MTLHGIAVFEMEKKLELRLQRGYLLRSIGFTAPLTFAFLSEVIVR
jgi:hypothetical protein